MGHEFSAGAVCSDGESAANDLAEAGDVGVDAVEGLCAAVGYSEAGDYFVEDEEAAVVAGDASEARLGSRDRRVRRPCFRRWAR